MDGGVEKGVHEAWRNGEKDFLVEYTEHYG